MDPLRCACAKRRAQFGDDSSGGRRNNSNRNKVKPDPYGYESIRSRVPARMTMYVGSVIIHILAIAPRFRAYAAQVAQSAIHQTPMLKLFPRASQSVGSCPLPAGASPLLRHPIGRGRCDGVGRDCGGGFRHPIFPGVRSRWSIAQ